MTADPVTATVHIDAPPERVWEYFTQPEAIIRWMGEYAVLEPEPGGQFTLNVTGAPVRGRFLSLDPPRRLVISWGYAGSDRLPPGASTVEVRLIPEGTGTRVDLEHRDLPPAEQPGHATGWTHYLARLTVAPAGDPGPDPGMGYTVNLKLQDGQRVPWDGGPSASGTATSRPTLRCGAPSGGRSSSG